MTSAQAQAPKAEKGSNFFLGFLFLPQDERQALSAVYGYCRLIDDVVDEPATPKDEARRQLDFWRGEIDRLFSGSPTHDVSRRLLPAIQRFRLPREPFLELIRGCGMDLDGVRYETYEQLESYMQGVACSVGRLSVAIFGPERTAAADRERFAEHFGYAFQLTNIIRDVGADLELGRVYLPDSELREAGYTREQLVRREHTPAFDRLMEGLYKRAHAHYQRGRNLVDFRDRPRLLPAEVMAHIYEALLEDIRGGGYRVLFSRATLSPWRKARLAARAWLYCHGL